MLYVEGGGNTKALQVECREGFRQFVTAAGITKRPRIVACGSRKDAYDSYCIAIKNGETAFLLVDAEESVSAKFQEGEQEEWRPWGHLKNRVGDGWEKPDNCKDTDCHLMTQLMESWFLADREVLVEFFGQDFKTNKLPAITVGIESISKNTVYSTLNDATKDCKSKGAYGKGNHSFKILSAISPTKVIAASPWAERFIDALKKKMDE